MIETEVFTEAGPGAEFAIGLATDGATLYVAARLRRWTVADGDKERIQVRLRFLRGSAHGPPLDVWLAIPRGRRGGGAVTLASPGGAAESVRGARMHVEPYSQGFNLEAAIPWEALPPAVESRLGLRASVGYEFQGRWVNGVVVGFGYPDGALVPLPIEQSLLSDLDPEARRLWPGAMRSWLDAGGDFPYATDILGDARLERIGRIGGRVSICRVESSGASGRCQRLDYGPGTRIEGIEAHDVFARGKKDLIVRYWRPTSTANHLVLEVLTPAANDDLRPVFRHEVSVYMHCCGSEANAPPHVRSEVRIGSGAIEIRAERPWRLTQRTFNEPPLGDGILPIVAPWDNPPRRREHRAGESVASGAAGYRQGTRRD